MKKSTKAACLSLLIPGAGLLYCGRRQWALWNLLAGVTVPLVLLWSGFPGEHVLWILLGIAAGSAGWANAVAQQSMVNVRVFRPGQE